MPTKGKALRRSVRLFTRISHLVKDLCLLQYFRVTNMFCSVIEPTVLALVPKLRVPRNVKCAGVPHCGDPGQYRIIAADMVLFSLLIAAGPSRTLER